ncbi:MAG: hypothetical protein M3506_03010 [Chloroflexota bacterium]|nr:hypothetical protein [Chloroflexota bacterium]
MTQSDQRAQQEQKMEQQLQVREVTQIQASWTEQERGAPGAFSMQLILDNGVEEYIIRPTADDADVLLQLLQRSNHATFDMGRKVLMFSNLDID